ncbi:MAG: pyridoxine 5'-phosphate synthase [Desulfobacteraceae bacterium]|nr:MAG: pyridoxine 5'-phosphate synthase [Desulfobacteraceae bacterium]
MINLSVNVNKVATLRNARGGDEPNVLQAARTCIEAGCQGITVHPREDQRHIRPADVHDLAAMLTVEFNIEGDPRPDLLDLVMEVRPAQCTLVPTEPGEITSHHGWNIEKDDKILRPAIERLNTEGIRVSLFMDPEPSSMALAAAVGADRVELYTGPYASAKTKAEIANEFARLREAHDAALDAGMELNAGHDLDLDNLHRLRDLPGIKEVSIGHALISHALYVGLSQAVKDFRRACGQEI